MAAGRVQRQASEMSGDELRVHVPEEHYTLFGTSRSGKPEVVVVNDALLSFQWLDVFPWHLSLTLEAEELIDNGMPSPSESAILFEIGDEIEALVSAGTTAHGSVNALFLARSTWNGTRELLFQVHDPEVAHSALQGLLTAREWRRKWSYEMRKDVEWTAAKSLFQLFPLARGADA